MYCLILKAMDEYLLLGKLTKLTVLLFIPTTECITKLSQYIRKTFVSLKCTHDSNPSSIISLHSVQLLNSLSETHSIMCGKG